MKTSYGDLTGFEDLFGRWMAERSTKEEIDWGYKFEGSGVPLLLMDLSISDRDREDF